VAPPGGRRTSQSLSSSGDCPAVSSHNTSGRFPHTNLLLGWPLVWKTWKCQGIWQIDIKVLFTLDGYDKGLRGHSKRICKPRFNRILGNIFFSNRVIDRRNSLDQDAVDAPILNCFKNRLNKLDPQGWVSSWTGPLNPRRPRVGWPQDKAAQGKHSFLPTNSLWNQLGNWRWGCCERVQLVSSSTSLTPARSVIARSGRSSRPNQVNFRFPLSSAMTSLTCVQSALTECLDITMACRLVKAVKVWTFWTFIEICMINNKLMRSSRVLHPLNKFRHHLKIG